MDYRLNLGCGYTQPADWVNVDKVNYGVVAQVVADILEGLPFPDDFFDFVFMNHTLQMFHYDKLPLVFAEVRRVMKPQARLRILVPDLDIALSNLEFGFSEAFPISDETESTLSGKFARYLFWHGDTRCAFNYDSLEDLLLRNGFSMVQERRYGECELDSRKDESLIVEAMI